MIYLCIGRRNGLACDLLFHFYGMELCYVIFHERKRVMMGLFSYFCIFQVELRARRKDHILFYLSVAVLLKNG
jgi:hypothetical protein